MIAWIRFESYVIFAGNKTEKALQDATGEFESYVIFAGNKTPGCR